MADKNVDSNDNSKGENVTNDETSIKRDESNIGGNSGILSGPKPTLQTMTVRRYLDETVVPILLTGMQALVKER